MERQIKKKLNDLGYQKKTIKKILDWYDLDKTSQDSRSKKTEDYSEQAVEVYGSCLRKKEDEKCRPPMKHKKHDVGQSCCQPL